MSNIINSTSKPWFVATANFVTSSATGNGTAFNPVFNAFTGSGYSTSTGLFTAPISGWYLFDVNMDCGNIQTSMTLATYFLVTTSQTYQFSNFNPAAIKGPSGACMSAATLLTFLAKNNTAFPRIIISNSTKVTNWNGTSSFFSGVRLY